MTRSSRASGDVYRSARLAAGYAFARPPVHTPIVKLIAQRLRGLAAAVCHRALDVGCGAGLSTAPLSRLAPVVVGVDPAAPMLEHCEAVAPAAGFAVADAEALPFPDATFDLVTCAGALNYTDVGRALAEIARVLTPSGTLVVYDFSAGRRCGGDVDLDGWFGAFEARYPFPPGYALDVAALDYGAVGLRLQSFETFTVPLALAPDAYLAYVLSETNVQRAVSEGISEEDISAWCHTTLHSLTGGAPLEVLFDGYIACMVKGAGGGAPASKKVVAPPAQEGLLTDRPQGPPNRRRDATSNLVEDPDGRDSRSGRPGEIRWTCAGADRAPDHRRYRG